MSSIAYEWGTRPEERALPFPCDRYLPDANVTCFRGLDVDASPAILFRWLCQLRVAPYSYDWIDNFGRQSPRTLTPGLERLEVGQRVMTLFELVEFETDRHVTAVTRRTTAEAMLGRVACSYVVVPRASKHVTMNDGSRLLVKLLARYHRGPLGYVLRRLLPWGDLVMMRKQLYNLKELAERSAAAARSEV